MESLINYTLPSKSSISMQKDGHYLEGKHAHKRFVNNLGSVGFSELIECRGCSNEERFSAGEGRSNFC